jgi:nucleotide-binding universal stress UspA family protein
MFRSIVVPIDLSEIEISRPAIDMAVALAKESGGRVMLVNVVPIMPVMMLDTVPVTYEAEVAEKAKTALSDLADAIDLPPGRVGAVVKIGGVYHEVLDVATQEGADLVVVGSHRPAMATYLLGSNATAIVRHATCSVLVLREPEGRARRPSPPAQPRSMPIG